MRVCVCWGMRVGSEDSFPELVLTSHLAEALPLLFLLLGCVLEGSWLMSFWAVVLSPPPISP